jgi:hypothetical protein
MTKIFDKSRILPFRFHQDQSRHDRVLWKEIQHLVSGQQHNKDFMHIIFVSRKWLCMVSDVLVTSMPISLAFLTRPHYFTFRSLHLWKWRFRSPGERTIARAAIWHGHVRTRTHPCCPLGHTTTDYTVIHWLRTGLCNFAKIWWVYKKLSESLLFFCPLPTATLPPIKKEKEG